SGSTFPVGTTTVNVTATDASGNTATCSFDVTILDVQPPTISCASNVTFDADPATCSKANVQLDQPMVSDNCTTTPVEITATRSDNKLLTEPFPVGPTTVTWTATDANGLTAVCNQTVTIVD